jgi:hypothetical protein
MQPITKSTKKPKEFRLLVGEMIVEDGKAKPNPDKGELRFTTREGMLFFEWRNLDKKIDREPLIIFPGEWDWIRLGSQKGRVFMLQNTTFPEDKSIFWMQYPKKEEDDMNAIIIGNILKTGALIIDESVGGDEYQYQDENANYNVSGVEDMMRSEQRNPNTNTNTNNNIQSNSSNSNSDFIKNFASGLKNVGGGAKAKYPELGKILTSSNVLKAVDDNNIEELIKYNIMI